VTRCRKGANIVVPHIGVPELLIVLVIVLVIFGAGRLTDIMGALGKGIKEFRQGTQADEPKPAAPTPAQAQAQPQPQPQPQPQTQDQTANNA
jgi:sec-independent protein translocase protein TatA